MMNPAEILSATIHHGQEKIKRPFLEKAVLGFIGGKADRPAPISEREAAVTLSPNWQIVKRAQKASAGPVYLNGYIIQIREWTTKFIDADTGKEFFLSKAFITNGGILFGRFGLGLGTSRSCSPPDEFQIMHMINIDQLLKQGEIK